MENIINWTNELIELEILRMVKTLKMESMPTHKEMNAFFQDYKLSNAVRRHGGTAFWTKKLNLKTKDCETKIGENYEQYCFDFLVGNFDYSCEFTQRRYPYDILVNESIKIDVKCGKKVYTHKCPYYTFNLEKTKPTCDIYICYCTDENEIIKTYVIPSIIMYGKGQLSLGINRSKYDKYIDRWDILEKYDEFYKEITNL